MKTKNGYIVNFTPDRKTATPAGTQEYVSKGVGSKIESMVMFVVSVIACVGKKQTSRILKTKLATRQSNKEVIDPLHIMHIFCIAMENIFAVNKRPLAVKRRKYKRKSGSSRVFEEEEEEKKERRL